MPKKTIMSPLVGSTLIGNQAMGAPGPRVRLDALLADER